MCPWIDTIFIMQQFVTSTKSVCFLLDSVDSKSGGSLHKARQRFCTFSSKSISVLYQGLHTTEAYSKNGVTDVV